MKTSLLHTALCAFLLGGLSACSKNEKAEAEHGHSHHVHVAPHGGALIEIGEHQFNLELIRDAAAGTLTAYVLDAHAENFVRVPLPSIALSAQVAGETKSLTLVATANPATGETIGDTSQFTTQADWLKTTASFDGVVTDLSLRGTRFDRTEFNFPKGNDDHAK